MCKQMWKERGLKLKIENDRLENFETAMGFESQIMCRHCKNILRWPKECSNNAC